MVGVPPLGGGAAVLLRPPPQVNQQPVLEGVDGLVGVEARKARLTLGLGLGVNRRQGQQVVLVTEAADGPHVKEGSLRSDLRQRTNHRGELSLSVRVQCVPQEWSRFLDRCTQISLYSMPQYDTSISNFRY